MNSNEFFIVHKKILPEYYEKVVEVREMLKRGECKDISEAVKKIGISRSTYYKYKDYIFRMSDDSSSRKAVISMILHHQAGTLGSVLGLLSEHGANVITISQNPPISGRASAVICIDIDGLSCSLSELIKSLSGMKGVENPSLVDVA